MAIARVVFMGIRMVVSIQIKMIRKATKDQVMAVMIVHSMVFK